MTETASVGNPNLGKTPVSAAMYERMKVEMPQFLHTVYNFEDRKGELLWRLNARLNGKDPGMPVNWRGL